MLRGAGRCFVGLLARQVRKRRKCTTRPVFPAGTPYNARAVADYPETAITHLTARRRCPLELKAAVVEIGELVRRRPGLIAAADTARGARKRLSRDIGNTMKKRGGGGVDDDVVERLKREVGGLVELIASKEGELARVDSACEERFAALPNVLDPRVPDGDDENENEVVSEWWGGVKKATQQSRWHDEVMESLSEGGADTEGAAGIAGARFSVLLGNVARLERALGNFFLDLHCGEHGYTEVSVPLIANRSTLEGTGQLPKFEAELFRLARRHRFGGEDGFLIPTAEVPLTGLHRGEILDTRELPLRYAALTPCFRAEAGSAGRDVRGLFRQHQFHKCEMVSVVGSPEEAAREHERMRRHAEICLELLELPYRTVRLCSGDIGFSARHCYDLEVWLPSQGRFREISSLSDCGDLATARYAVFVRIIK